MGGLLIDDLRYHTEKAANVTEISPRELLKQLEESAARLAAPASEQAEWLRHGAAMALPVDELALDYFDSVPLWFPRLKRHRLLPESSGRALTQLHDALDEMIDGGDQRLWESDEALFIHPEWGNIRLLAKKALAEIRKTLADP